MADVITNTDELQIELLNASGDNRRILRVPDPISGLNRSDIEEALEPAFAHANGASDSAIVPFFFDDTDKSVGLTRIGTIERIRIQRTVTKIE